MSSLPVDVCLLVSFLCELLVILNAVPVRSSILLMVSLSALSMTTSPCVVLTKAPWLPFTWHR